MPLPSLGAEWFGSPRPIERRSSERVVLKKKHPKNHLSFLSFFFLPRVGFSPCLFFPNARHALCRGCIAELKQTALLGAKCHSGNTELSSEMRTQFVPKRCAVGMGWPLTPPPPGPAPSPALPSALRHIMGLIRNCLVNRISHGNLESPPLHFVTLFILFCNFLLELGVSGPPREMDSSSVLSGAGGVGPKKLSSV